MTTVISLIAPGAKKPGYATDSSEENNGHSQSKQSILKPISNSYPPKEITGQ